MFAVNQIRSHTQQQLRKAVIAALLLTSIGCTTSSVTRPQSATDPAKPLTPEQIIQTTISADIGFPVSLSVATTNRCGDWRFIAGHPVHTDGARIDYLATRYAADWQEGYFEDVFLALLEFRISEEQYQLIEFSFGATDAPFIDWAKQHSLPMELFSNNQSEPETCHAD